MAITIQRSYYSTSALTLLLWTHRESPYSRARNALSARCVFRTHGSESSPPRRGRGCFPSDPPLIRFSRTVKEGNFIAFFYCGPTENRTRDSVMRRLRYTTYLWAPVRSEMETRFLFRPNAGPKADAYGPLALSGRGEYSHGHTRHPLLAPLLGTMDLSPFGQILSPDP